MLEGGQQQRFTFSLGFGLLLVGKKGQKEKRSGVEGQRKQLASSQGCEQEVGANRRHFAKLKFQQAFRSGDKGRYCKGHGAVHTIKGRPRSCRTTGFLFGAARRRRGACVMCSHPKECLGSRRRERSWEEGTKGGESGYRSDRTSAAVAKWVSRVSHLNKHTGCSFEKRRQTHSGSTDLIGLIH